MSYSTNPSVGTMDQSGTVKSISTGQRSSVTVQCSEYVVDRPYLRVYNSDTIAGSGFGVTCTTPDADIKGYIRQIASPPGYVGAGGQLGVFAKGSVTNFLSMSMSDAAMTDPLVNARTFAHESGTNTGGSFGQTYCATDFWNTRQSGLTSGGIAPADISAVSGQRQYDSGSTIHASSPISTQMAIYIDGDLTIDGDIKTTTGPWADVNAIPSVQVIVRGNIYILPSVKQLDGLYVAMPTNASNGRIVTCTNAAGVVHPSDTVISTVCRNNTLTVNGAFVAQQVNFFRGKGSLRSAQTSTITTTTSTPGGFGPQNTCTSPVIMYQDWRLSGATKTFTKGTYKNKTELTASFYDAISSMQVPVGCKVTVYKGDNLTGASKTMTSDWSVNDGYDGGSSIGWNDVIKSFKVEDANPGESQIGFIWSYSGIVDSTKDDCLSIVEAADNLWATPGDNYLCWPKGRNYGLQFSQSGAVAGKTCTQMYEADGSWTDNYLCWNTAANLQLTWLYANSYMNYPSGTLINGNYCTRIFEPAEATAGINHVPLDYWDNNYLCEPVRAGTPSMVPLPPIVTTTVTPSAGELANSPNIAEVFNYTPEMLLGTPASKPVVDRSAYDSLVSLPPAL